MAKIKNNKEETSKGFKPSNAEENPSKTEWKTLHLKSVEYDFKPNESIEIYLPKRVNWEDKISWPKDDFKIINIGVSHVPFEKLMKHG